MGSHANLMVQKFTPGTYGQPGAMDRESRVGDGWCAWPKFVEDATGGAYTITTDAIKRGGYKRNGGAGDRVDTLPTGTVLDAAFPEMAIGDSLVFMVSNIGTTNSLTVTSAASGATASGNVAVLANTNIFVLMTKTAASTYTFNCL